MEIKQKQQHGSHWPRARQPVVMVLPKSEAVCKCIAHPTGRRFRNLTTPVDWPADQFTFRRLADGTAIRVDPNTPPPIVA